MPVVIIIHDKPFTANYFRESLPNRYSALCWRPVTHAKTWASYSALYRFGRFALLSCCVFLLVVVDYLAISRNSPRRIYANTKLLTLILTLTRGPYKSPRHMAKYRMLNVSCTFFAFVHITFNLFKRNGCGSLISRWWSVSSSAKLLRLTADIITHIKQLITTLSLIHGAIVITEVSAKVNKATNANKINVNVKYWWA